MVHRPDESASRTAQADNWSHYAWRDVVRDLHRVPDLVHAHFSGICVWDLGFEFQTDHAVADPQHELDHAERSADGRAALRAHGHRDGKCGTDGAPFLVDPDDHIARAWRALHRRSDHVDDLAGFEDLFILIDKGDLLRLIFVLVLLICCFGLREAILLFFSIRLISTKMGKGCMAGSFKI